MNIEQIKNYLDQDNKVKVWPSKRKNKLLILECIVEALERDVKYTEKELDEYIYQYISFDDHVIVRREMYENKLIDRTQDGREYWRI